jgi:hypothetical protein
MRDRNVMRVLSLGGGTQSCALALMSACGELPKLDHIVFADTQGELPETYAYLDYLSSIVEPAGIPLHVVTAGNLERAILGERLPVNPTPPAHMLHADGSKGRINGYKCSYDFKRRQVERKVKQLCGDRGAWRTTDVEQWIGFSLDEVGRMRPHPWMRNRWPLIELRMKRDDTIRWFTANGHPVPPRSACWFCPNSGNDRWQSLRSDHPDLFERACQIDDAIRSVGDFKNHEGPRRFAAGSTFYLHASLVPLRTADTRTARQLATDSGQSELFDDDALALDCTAGVCFT